MNHDSTPSNAEVRDPNRTKTWNGLSALAGFAFWDMGRCPMLVSIGPLALGQSAASIPGQVGELGQRQRRAFIPAWRNAPCHGDNKAISANSSRRNQMKADGVVHPVGGCQQLFMILSSGGRYWILGTNRSAKRVPPLLLTSLTKGLVRDA